MTRRYDHSISSYTVSDECVWIVITGGYKRDNSESKTSTDITHADTTVLELGMLTLHHNQYIKTVRKYNNEIVGSFIISNNYIVICSLIIINDDSERKCLIVFIISSLNTHTHTYTVVYIPSI